LSWTRLSLLLLFLAGRAFAALPDEIQVYTDDLEAAGERGIELHVNTTPGGRSRPGYPGEVPTFHGLRVTPEISWGLGHDMDWGLYLPFVRSAEGAYWFAGPKLRFKWLPVRPAEGGAGRFLGVNLELAHVQSRFEEARTRGEIRPIGGWRGERWLFAFNPILEFDLAGGQNGVAMFSPAFKAARDVGNAHALGVEYYGELGRLSGFAPRAEQAHTLYLTLDTPRLNFGIGRGFSGQADRWTIKTILSF